MSKTKCKHTETQDTLIIESGRQYSNMTSIRKAVLVETCKDCESEQSYFIMGGILHNGAELDI